MQIRVENLHFSYGSRKIFDNISFSIEPNEVTAIVGVSGCGKSTLLKLLAGLKKTNKGEITYGDDRKEKIDDISTAVIFQDNTLFPWKTVAQNIKLACKNNIDIQEIAKEVGLYDSLNLYPDELSGGMKQRAEFGRVLARSPKVLFMDEPFSRLDIQYRHHLQEIFMKIQNKHKPTTVIVTHDISEAIKVSKHIKVLIGNPVRQISEFEIDALQPSLIREKVENILYKDFNTNFKSR